MKNKLHFSTRFTFTKRNQIQKTMYNDKVMLTVEEMALYTGFSKSHIYKLTSTAAIPHYKPGKKVIFFKKEEIDFWMQSNKIEQK